MLWTLINFPNVAGPWTFAGFNTYVSACICFTKAPETFIIPWLPILTSIMLLSDIDAE